MSTAARAVAECKAPAWTIAALLLLVCASFPLGCEVIAPVLMDIDAAEDPPAPPPDAVADTPLPGGATVLAAGDVFTTAIWSDTLYTWGANDRGQLAQSDMVMRSTPTRVAGVTAWTDVRAGAAAACALSMGTVYCWGANDNANLGLGDLNDRSTPTMVSCLTSVRTYDFHFTHGCAISSDGSLWCWGQNDEGELAQNEWPPNVYLTPVRVGTDTWTSVVNGQGHVCAIRTDGTLWCWGRNSPDYELGLGPNTSLQYRTPQQVGTANDWAQIVAGQDHTCGIRSPGTLWCWGADGLGEVGDGISQPGDGSMEPSIAAPLQVGSLTTWRSLTAGDLHTCGIQTDGTLWCWGNNSDGELGLGDMTNRTTPQQVGTSTDWNTLTAGRYHTCATKLDLSVWCAGLNTQGQLGFVDLMKRSMFTRVF